MEDSICPDLYSLVRSLNWYLQRKKEYGETEFNKWKTSNAAKNNSIKAKINNFDFNTLVKCIQDYFKLLDAKATQLDKAHLYFLENYENLEIFMIDETLESLRTKHCAVADIGTAFAKMSLNVNINIENLSGAEDEWLEMEDWFENFERIGNSNGWTNEVKALKLPCYLKDTALLVWQNQSTTAKDNYVESKKNIINKLKPDESMEQLFFSKKQKSSESVIEFGLGLEKLAKRIFPGQNKEKELVNVYWKGLLPSVRKLTLTASPTKLKDAIEIAKRAEQFYKEQDKLTQKAQEKESPKVNSVESRRNTRPSRSSSRDRSGSGGRRQHSPVKGNACYRCGKEGHIARNCRDRSPTPRRTECFKCGKRGHVAKNCRSKNSYTPALRG